MIEPVVASAETEAPAGAGRDASPGGVSLPELDLPALCEALLFVAAAPTPAADLAKAIGVDAAAIDDALTHLDATLRESGSGLRLLRHGDGYALTTAPAAARTIARFLGLSRTERLSAAALETLAIVAYKQPISRAQIASIRGVDPDGVLRTLQGRGYVDAVGRDDGPGQAVLYGTTRTFLERLGLDSVDDLPPIADFIPGADVVEALEHGLRPNHDRPAG
jgi:segregation and condensation protein B